MKQRFPDCTIVFGGPSARPAVLDLAPYRKAIDYVDAVVTRDGEIIMGLPGDSPEQFRRSFYRARTFPCALRGYHCCVLPSALMVRSLAEHALDYDSITLKMRSCLGWSREAMLRECEFLNQKTQASHGQVGDYFWVFSAPKSSDRKQKNKAIV